MAGDIMYEIKSLEATRFEALANTWNAAFSDYIVPMNISPERMEAYCKVSGVDRSKSFGAFYQGELVGMLFNSIGVFKGKEAAYDAMTGIAPGHRGKGLFSRLFEHTRNSLRECGVSHYFLEVITTNESAFSIYKKKGGKIERELSFLEGRLNADYFNDIEVQIMPLSDFQRDRLSQYQPTYGNQLAALRRNADNYKIAYAQDGGRKSAAVFSSQGGISQILFCGESDLLRAVFTHLSKNFEKLSISNIPISEAGLISELLSAGFTVKVNQYEMCIEL